jgi:hypothetical protein
MQPSIIRAQIKNTISRIYQQGWHTNENKQLGATTVSCVGEQITKSLGKKKTAQ